MRLKQHSSRPTPRLAQAEVQCGLRLAPLEWPLGLQVVGIHLLETGVLSSPVESALGAVGCAHHAATPRARPCEPSGADNAWELRWGHS